MEEIIKKIRAIISDIDGVLTSGEIIIDSRGEELKIFNVRDGNGIKMWLSAGYKFAFLSGRVSKPVDFRAHELGVDVIQGTHCKVESGEKLLEKWGISWEEVAYIGDDIVDLPIMRKVGFPVAVGDAAAEVKNEALYITSSPGGKGAVREVIEMILKTKEEWEKAGEKFFREEDVQGP